MEQRLSDWFHDTVSALVYSLAQPHALEAHLGGPHNDLTRFINDQRGRLPDYLRRPMLLAGIGLDASTILSMGRPFHTLSPEDRLQQIQRWKSAPFGPVREFVRYVESLATYRLYSRDGTGDDVSSNSGKGTLRTQRPPYDPDSTERAAERLYQVAVVGSGPGGAVTAALLAEAGKDVILVEEGPFTGPDAVPAFSTEEMVRLYRCGGQTVALGADKIAYVEGRCVGGGSEINSGLYHRCPGEVLERWHDEFLLAHAQEEDLKPHFEACERDLSVSLMPDGAPRASLKLHEGAQRLGWRSYEVPRWFRYPQGALPERQSMTRTYIPRFLSAGGVLLANQRVMRVRTGGRHWHLEAHGTGGRKIIRCEHLFIAAGAVQTPALLRRSGITRNIGNALRLHPTVKVVAEFAEAVNARDMGVPVHQVKEFSPRLSFGCSISTPPYLALGLLGKGADVGLASCWQRMANYYAMSAGASTGTVRTLPGFTDPLVRYNLDGGERANLADGLRLLSRALFAAGATRLYAGLRETPVFESEADLTRLPSVLQRGQANLMTIHLFSSCPMGEARDRAATDSFGKVHGFGNLYVADASLLCTPPTVNPQGTIMALARRNALRFLGKL